MLEKLWNEYLWEESCAVETDREKELARSALVMHERVNALLTAEQQEALEHYVNALNAMDSHSAQKAFIKGCKFAASFLIDTLTR